MVSLPEKCPNGKLASLEQAVVRNFGGEKCYSPGTQAMRRVGPSQRVRDGDLNNTHPPTPVPLLSPSLVHRSPSTPGVTDRFGGIQLDARAGGQNEFSVVPKAPCNPFVVKSLNSEAPSPLTHISLRGLPPQHTRLTGFCHRNLGSASPRARHWLAGFF